VFLLKRISFVRPAYPAIATSTTPLHVYHLCSFTITFVAYYHIQMRRGPIWLYDLGQIFGASEKQEDLIRHAPLESVAIVDGAHRRVRCAWLGRCLLTSWMALRGAQETDAECPAEYPRVRVRMFWVARAEFFVDCVRVPARSEQRQRRTMRKWASALARSSCPTW